MSNQVRWQEHRSGWGFVLDILEPYNNSPGLLFDGLIDISFAGYNEFNRNNNIIPYKEPWIGFLHSAINLCPFLENKFDSLDNLLSDSKFVESLSLCKGIFTFSNHVCSYLKNKIKPHFEILPLKHPTQTPEELFEFTRFSKDRTILHVGNWLRNISSFCELKTDNFKKILLLNPATPAYINHENEFFGFNKCNMKDIVVLNHVSNSKYDIMLSKSIVFLNLCDSNACNTIIECIVRNTPLLINKHPSAVEYLGENYPFYYTSIQEAELKISSDKYITETYEYLANCDLKKELTSEFFLSSFLNSAIINNITKSN